MNQRHGKSAWIRLTEARVERISWSDKNAAAWLAFDSALRDSPTSLVAAREIAASADRLRDLDLEIVRLEEALGKLRNAEFEADERQMVGWQRG